jgi:LPXTG-motif cell wall-anchored protein
MKKTFIVAAVALLGIAAMGAVSSNSASATQSDPDGEHKVWVCHATSGMGELKNGYDLIHVDVASVQYEAHMAHSQEGGEKVNKKFGDAPDFYLYDYIDVDPQNLPGKCGAPPEEPTVVTPVAPTLTTPTCDVQPTVVLPKIEGLVYTPTTEADGSIVVTVEATEGYVLAEGSTTSWTFPATQLAKLPATDPLCTVPVPTTQPPAQTPAVAALPPTQPATQTAVLAAVPAAAPAAAPTALPTTGGESWAIFLIGLTSLLGGAALVKLSRRPA